MSDARDAALAQLTEALDPEVMGTLHLIDGNPLAVVMRSLTIEETQSLIGSGHYSTAMAVEGCRITVGRASLGWEPGLGQSMDVDGVAYTVAQVTRIGGNLRLTLTRYAR